MKGLLKNLAIVCFVILSWSLSAQNHYTVFPGNSNQVTSEIFTDFEHLIDITPAELNTHLTGLIDPSNYCPTCPNSELEIANDQANTLQLEWDPVVGANYYNLEYINLSSGDAHNYVSYSASISIINLPNGPYAFSLVSVSTQDGVAKDSKGDIIIIETPILIDEGLIDCNCDRGESIVEKPINSTITWEPEAYKRYKFTANFSNDYVVEFILKAYPSEDPTYPFNFNLECYSNLTHSAGSNTLGKPYPNPDVSIYLTYQEAYIFHFFSQDNPLLNMVITECERARPRGSEIENSHSKGFHLYPNPVSDQLTIDYHSDATVATELQIFDIKGQLIYSASQFESSTNINVKDWPIGVYHVKLFHGDKLKSSQFIKLK